MIQPRSKEIDDELQPGMARLFASNNSEVSENQTLDSDKIKSEKTFYGNSVNHQESQRTQSKPIFNVSNHINSKQEELQKNPSSLKNSLNFNPKIQSNRALSSMLRKIQSRQNEPQYQNKISNAYNENPSQLSNMQGMANQISGFNPNQNISEYSNSQKSYYPKSQFKYQTNYFENSNQPDSRAHNNLRNSSFQGKEESSINNLNQQISNSSKVNYQKSNYTGKYPMPPPPKLPPKGQENPPFLSFGSDKGINPYQIDHKNPYDSSLTDALSESISGDKRFSSRDEIKENNYQNSGRNSNYSNDNFKNNQINAQNRNQNPNIYQKTRIDQVNQLNQLKRVNLRNQTTSLFTNTQNQKSMNQDPSYKFSGDNNYENYHQKEFGQYNERSNVNQSIHPNRPNQPNQPNQYSNFNEKSNINRDYSQRNEQKRFTLNFNDSYQSNDQNSSNFGSIQPNSQNYQNSDTWDNFHRKTLSLKERLYKPSSNKLGFQGYSQENPFENENNCKTPFQVENAKFRNDQQESFSNFSQNNSLHNNLQDNLLNNTANNTNEIEEDPEQRELTIIENLHYIQQAEPVKLEVIHLLMDRNKHPDCQLLREIKRNRYMGSVALGMILYNLIETFGSDMISKNYEEGNDIYYISERFSDLLERAFNI